MGWDCFSIPDTRRRTRKNALKNEVTRICKKVRADNFVDGPRDDEYYAACELKDKHAAFDGEVIGVVGIGQLDHGGCDYCVKKMTEKSGPAIYRASESVLNELSEPAPNDYAKKWREKCQ